ncbi:long-chain-fatty-acid--CoA ligase [Amycolatopsis pithecellobii]|uniref:Long-chain-fatty-acid--CoA ligase n=1 Tax=Amycolatopsis pithecellobii TaxID=664692 RepID=A0A6N7Z1M9_9PSEU|nr:long-chain-fatty-acid--CoA ligase [Amycolatopsis pithecellobii]MTD54709.1 long-chain-fatty-acid--CoA ligase [Amycolatopsis pithecellobii]
MRSTMQDTPLTVPHFLHRSAAYFPDRHIVTTTPSGTRRSTYGDWATRVGRLAGALDELGVGAGSSVGYYGWNTASQLEVYFATVCTGRVFHSINARLPADHVGYTIGHAEDEVIFVQKSLLDGLGAVIEKGHNRVKQVVVVSDPDDDSPVVDRTLDYEAVLSAASPVGLSVADERLPASICYSGGTTGLPKAVVYSHRALYLHTMSLLQTDNVGISESDVVLPLVPMAHANGWGLPQAAVAAGATLVLPGRDLSGPKIAELIASEAVSVSAAVPTVWTRVLPELAGKDTKAVRELCSGGSAASARLMDLAREVTGRPLLQVWGMTETGAFAALARERSKDAAGRAAAVRASQGFPVAGIDMRVVDPDTRTPVPRDGTTIGELQCHGPSVIASYHDDARSPEAFTVDGWLRTGDMAVVDSEGCLRLVDRTKDVIKSGGEWVSSIDLEHALLAHPAIASAAVFGVPSEEWGERPVACVVPHPGMALDSDEVLRHLSGRVAKFWVPDRVLILGALPTTAVGKIDKKALRTTFEKTDT